jgi:hypothetical protein
MKTKLDSGRVASIIALISAVLVLALGWRVSHTSESVAAENALLRNALESPLVIRDYELDILPYMTPVRSGDAPQPSNTEKAIFVAKQTCQYCAKQLPIWKDLATSSVLDKDAEIWLVSLGEANAFGDLAKTLTSQGRSYREFRVGSIAAFVLCTGIRATPTTIIAKDNRVRLVYPGLFTDAVRNQMFSGGLLAPSTRVRFPSAGLSEATLR